ncbi:MAG: hypothetical protein WDN31_04750 [Hyphomicrobium sp.]
MRFPAIAVLAVAGGIASVPTMAMADSYWEVEAARANARAGGPTNARDAELLERYGCLSGTRSAFCERQAAGGARRYYRPSRRRAH